MGNTVLIGWMMALIVYWTYPVSAASIAIDQGSDCAISLTEKIIKGDFERFVQLANQVGLDRPPESGEPANTGDESLCLDSPGGSYFEARRISQFIHEKGIGTRIRASAECYSACAVIFMAGRLAGPEMVISHRHLHVKGHLGFHAPYLDVDDNDSFSGAEIKAITLSLSLVMSDFVRFGATRAFDSYKPTLAPSLIWKMLAATPDKMVIVDTVDSAARWNIQLDGVNVHIDYSKHGALQACYNFSAWADDTEAHIVKVVQEANISQVKGLLFGRLESFEKTDIGGYYEHYCLISDVKEKEDLVICEHNDFRLIRRGDCLKGGEFDGLWIPRYYLLAPNTPLSDLSGNVTAHLPRLA